ncbi:MAG: VWA domain-containing protein, partial [Candidatus Bipolaricaulia bacterium]
MRTRLLSLTVTALVVCSIGLAVGAAPEDVVFILDASNSMNKPFDTDTRIAAAKGALSDLLSGLPEQGSVGLMIYGHRINHENEVESCQDIELLFPLAPFTGSARNNMIGAFRQIDAKGKTPLADSLVAAANEFEAGGTIILVSDGEGNCGGEHDVIAAMLATMDPPIILHVVGIDVEDEAGETLRSIALATSGSYWS